MADGPVGPVIVLQAGTAVNYFGTGLILPFEIIYLHDVRGFPTATAGLVLAAVMGTAAAVTLPAGALLDRFPAKPIVIIGNLVSALGYSALAFVDRPWQGFVCSAVSGAGFAVAGTANQQFIVLGPVVAELAPPHLLGRYMSLYGLSFTVGVALGPAVGSALLTASPDAIWWGGAMMLALTAAGFLGLGHRIPDPLSPTKSQPLHAVPEPT